MNLKLMCRYASTNFMNFISIDVTTKKCKGNVYCGIAFMALLQKTLSSYVMVSDENKEFF